MPIRAPSPYSNRFGSALIIAFCIHIGLLVLLSLHLAFSHPAPVPPAATEIQASLVAAEPPAQVPAPEAAPPPISTPSTPKPKPTPKPVKPVVPVAPAKPIDPPPTPPITPIIDDTANTTIVSKPPPSKHVTKMKQQTLKQALEQESQQEQQSPPAKTKPVDKQLLADAMISEIAAEAKASATKPVTNAAKATKATSTASSTEVNRFKAMILQQIQQNWIVPQHVEHLSCELKVELAPGGTVLNVTLLKSSGNDALDRSAINAINKASPLPTPTKSADFDAFRSFTITVKPEGSSFDEL